MFLDNEPNLLPSKVAWVDLPSQVQNSFNAQIIIEEIARLYANLDQATTFADLRLGFYNGTDKALSLVFHRFMAADVLDPAQCLSIEKSFSFCSTAIAKALRNIYYHRQKQGLPMVNFVPVYQKRIPNGDINAYTDKLFAGMLTEIDYPIDRKATLYWT